MERRGENAREEGKEWERNKERKVRDRGKEEESVYKEMRILGLLPGRKIFFRTLSSDYFVVI